MTETNPAIISARPRISIDDDARADLNAAVRDCSIRLPLSGMAQCEIRLINWGGTHDGADASFAFDDITFGQKIEIFMSESAEQALFTGDITAIEERYGDGAPQLVLLAEDKLHLLARLRDNRSFEEMSISDVISQLAQESSLDSDANIDTLGTWHQLNESNLAFLMRLLSPHGIAVRLQDGQLRARVEESDPDPIQLDTQNHIQQMRLIADLNQQPTEVQINSYDISADQAIENSTSSLSPAPSGSTAGDLLDELGWGNAERFPQPSPVSQDDGEAWSRGIYHRYAKRFVHGEITCGGIPTLRSGREVEISGASTRLTGLYQIVDCRHQFDSNNGYSTVIKVQRPYLLNT